MTLAVVLFLAVLQGIAEFLPISSSAHLRIAAELFGVEDPQTLFDVMLHIGTLVAVMLVYRTKVKGMASALVRLIRKKGSLSKEWQDNADLRLLLFLALATLPTGLMAILLGDWLEEVASSLFFLASAFTFNAFILFFLGHLLKNPQKEERLLEDMRIRDALLIGLAQGFSITRGISRSGSTITAAIALGFRQSDAATFSFLISIPAILGALVLSLKDSPQSSLPLNDALIGVFVAGIVGFFALKFLLRLLDRGRIDFFAYWCLAMGLFTFGLHFTSP